MRGKCAGKGRNVTPMRASTLNLRPYVPKLSQSDRQRRKLNRHRGVKADGRYPCGGSLLSGCRGAHGKGVMAASASRDCSQDSTSVTLPSGVSGFLLDCLEADSPSDFNMDSTLSSIEEFRRDDNCDEGTVRADGMMNSVRNSTLLDASHAQDLVLHQPPNLSSILELSLDTAEDKHKNSFSLSPIRLSPLQACVPPEPFRSSEITSAACVFKPAVNVKAAVKKQCLAGKEKPIRCRKVMFSDIVSIRNISSHKHSTVSLRHCGVQQDRRKEDVTGEVQTASEDISSGPAKLFDFADECEREAFFQRLKQTYSFQFPAKTIISIASTPSEETSVRTM